MVKVLREKGRLTEGGRTEWMEEEKETEGSKGIESQRGLNCEKRGEGERCSVEK